MLIAVEEDVDQFSGIGRHIDSLQKNGTILIGGRDYFRLKCHISNLCHNLPVVNGVAGNMYSQEKFHRDFKKG